MLAFDMKKEFIFPKRREIKKGWITPGRAALVITIGILVYFFVFKSGGLIDIVKTYREKKNLEHQILEQRRIQDSLRFVIKEFSDTTNLDLFERYIRENKGLIKNNEKVFRFE